MIKKISMACIAFGLAVVILGLMIPTSPKVVTKAQFDQIQEGMTINEVENRLGEGEVIDERETEAYTCTVVEYEAEEAAAVFVFKNGTVMSKRWE